MARLRRMYARLLFVVVGFLAGRLPGFIPRSAPVSELFLGMGWGGSYTAAHERSDPTGL